MRSFDAGADGVVFGSGMGLVLIKRLSDALRDGDPLAWQIVRDIRLPRALGAWLAGALFGLVMAALMRSLRRHRKLPDWRQFRARQAD